MKTRTALGAVALALLALPAAANARLVVPKSQAPAPITTPQASAPPPSSSPPSSGTGGGAPSSPPPSSSPTPSPQGSPTPAPSQPARPKISQQELEYYIRDTEREIRELQDRDAAWVPRLQEQLDRMKRELADMKAAQAAVDAKAAQERADLADQYAEANDVGAAAERQALADLYAQAQGLAPEGSYAGIVESILDIFQNAQKGSGAQSGPTAGVMPEGLPGELIVLGMSRIGVLLNSDEQRLRNSAQS